MKIPNVIKILIMFGIFAALVLLYASPYLAVRQIQSAVLQKDIEAMNEKIDFTVLRENLKEQFSEALAKSMQKNKMDNNTFFTLGALMASAVIDKMVDNTLTPNGLLILMSGNEQVQSTISNNNNYETFNSTTDNDFLSNTTLEYESFNEVIIVKKIDEKEIKAVLKRDGLFGWKLVNILIPSL